MDVGRPLKLDIIFYFHSWSEHFRCCDDFFRNLPRRHRVQITSKENSEIVCDGYPSSKNILLARKTPENDDTILHLSIAFNRVHDKRIPLDMLNTTISRLRRKLIPERWWTCDQWPTITIPIPINLRVHSLSFYSLPMVGQALSRG